ncbi:MAG: nitroreductase family protein [Anaerolineaceae bacterium]
MDVMEAIFTRRSIRRYTTEGISEEQVELLMRAAMAAPSAGNAQPWHFVVIDDHSILEEINSFHPYSEMLPRAALAVLVCGDEKLENHPGHWEQDCSAATQNILLAAHGNGLGAVWLGIEPDQDRVEQIRLMIGLPSHIHPVSLVALGHPDEVKRVSNRYKPERVRRNHW